MKKYFVLVLLLTILLTACIRKTDISDMIIEQAHPESVEKENKTEDFVIIEMLECGTDVELGLLQVETLYRICYNSNSFGIILENKGARKIDDFNLNVVGKDKLETLEGVGEELTQGMIKSYKFNFPTVNNIEKIILSPRFKARDNIIVCDEPNLKWEKDDLDEFDDCDDVTWDDKT